MGRVAWLTALCIALSANALASGVKAQEAGTEDVEAEASDTDGDAEGGVESADSVEDAAEVEPVDPADARARELYAEGDRLYAEGHYEEAVEAFVEAYSLSGRPLLLFNLANAYERLGAYEDAAESLTRYLEHAEEGERVTLERRIDALRERAEREREERDQAEGERRQATPQDATPGPPPDDTLAWVLIASGGVVALSSILLGGISLAATDEARGLCVEEGGQTLCPAEARAPLDRASALGLAADITAGVGLATLAVGAVILIINHAGGASASRAVVAPGGIGAEVVF